MRPLTERLYNIQARLFERWLNGRKPTKELAVRYIEELRATKKQNTVAVVRNALVWKFKFPLSSESIEIPEPRYLTVEQLKYVLSKSNALEKALISVQFDTATRISEVLGLRTSDIDWQSKVVTMMRKGGKKQKVPLGDQGVEALKEWLRVKGRGSKVFDCTYDEVRVMFQKLAKKCRLPHFTPHMLRHSRAIHLKRAGVKIEDISNILGHSRLDTTLKIYARETAEDMRQHLARW